MKLFTGDSPLVRRLSVKLGLPNSLDSYLENLRHLPDKVFGWLNALWQLQKCTQVGRWTRLKGRIHIHNEGEILIGERVQLHCHYARSVLTAFPGGRLEIGDRTVINYGADIACARSVKIGADCLIGTYSMILDTDFHEVEDHDKIPEPRPVTINNGAWIGNRVIILPGVTIGEGSVIGAGSVVMTDIPARSLAMGNPARVIKKF